MYKGTSDSRNYLRREGSHSTKPSARGVNLLGWALDETLSPQDQYKALSARVMQINHTFRDNKGMPKWQREALVAENATLVAQMQAIRPGRKEKRVHGVEQHFIEVARERLTKPEFKVWMDEAVRRKLATDTVNT